jgi:hypothetical protein
VLRAFVIAPSGQREFDSYLGFFPARIHRGLTRLRWAGFPDLPRYQRAGGILMKTLAIVTVVILLGAASFA